MSSILDQELVTIKQAAKLLPGRPHISTVWRWIERGISGRKLQCWKIGGVRYTSREALEAFIIASNDPAGPSLSRQRQKDIDRAEAELKEMGI